MKERCYWCGGAAIGKEHVPPENLYPPGMRTNLMTVPACHAHNQAFSTLDERVRVYLQQMANSPIARAAFEGKTMRGLKRKPGLLRQLAAASTPATLNGIETFAIKLPFRDADTYFEKVVRALYHLHLGRAFQGSITCACSHLIAEPPIDFTELIEKHRSWEHLYAEGLTSDDRVFKYRYISKPARAGDAETFVVHATFYESVTLFGYGLGA